MKATDAAKANSTTELCAANGLRVAAHTGTARVPAPMLASENASAWRCGEKMLAS